MRLQAIVILLAIPLFIPLAPRHAAAQGFSASVNIGGDVYGIDYFYDALAPYGDWVQSRDYGWVWTPASMEPGWRPYTIGHWVLTDDYGWMWASDEPFGWATCHYGRWYFDDDYGWCWVPGTHWGPGWVAWRQSDRYIGWAPLPPEARVVERGPSLYIDIDADVVSSYLRPFEWCFVRDRDFGRHHYRRDVYLPPAESVTIINNTTNITNYTVINNNIVNRSVDVRRIERATDRPIRPVHVHAVDERQWRSEEKQGRHVEGDVVSVYRPKVVQRGETRPAPPPQVVQKSRQEVNRIRARKEREVQQLRAQGVAVEARRGRSPGHEEREGRPGAPGTPPARVAPGQPQPGAVTTPGRPEQRPGTVHERGRTQGHEGQVTPPAVPGTQPGATTPRATRPGVTAPGTTTPPAREPGRAHGHEGQVTTPGAPGNRPGAAQPAPEARGRGRGREGRAPQPGMTQPQPGAPRSGTPQPGREERTRTRPPEDRRGGPAAGAPGAPGAERNAPGRERHAPNEMRMTPGRSREQFRSTPERGRERQATPPSRPQGRPEMRAPENRPEPRMERGGGRPEMRAPESRPEARGGGRPEARPEAARPDRGGGNRPEARRASPPDNRGGGRPEGQQPGGGPGERHGDGHGNRDRRGE